VLQGCEALGWLAGCAPQCSLLWLPSLCSPPPSKLPPTPTPPPPPSPQSGAGSDVNARDSYGQAPIHVATKNLDLPTISILLDHGAAVDAAMEPDGRMPL